MAELTPTTPSTCCSTEQQADCCEPQDKDGCCSAESTSCGCAAGETDDPVDVRELVRERYAAAARGDAGCSDAAAAAGTVALGDERGNQVFGAALYEDDAEDGVPEGVLSASLGCGVRPRSPTWSRARPSSTSARAPEPTF